MEYQMAQMFCRTSTPAPALNRGLAVLSILGQEAPLPLDMLATKLKLPRASVFRLLATLQMIGIIRKTPDKKYEPLWKLHALEDRAAMCRRRVESQMADLCASTNCTVEWYEPETGGIRLITQHHPDREVCVQARPGYFREWHGELEAVTRLALARTHNAPRLRSTRMYSSNGVLSSLGEREIKALVAEAKATGWAWDRAFNTNGVRRYAMAVIAEEKLYGVLAIAEAFQFRESHRAEEFRNTLTQTLKNCLP